MWTVWGLSLVPLESLLTCIVGWKKWNRPCLVTMNTLLWLVKCTPRMIQVKIFFTIKCSAKMCSAISNLSKFLDNAFSYWPFATCLRKLGASTPRCGCSFIFCEPSTTVGIFWRWWFDVDARLSDKSSGKLCHWKDIIALSAWVFCLQLNCFGISYWHGHCFSFEFFCCRVVWRFLWKVCNCWISEQKLKKAKR